MITPKLDKSRSCMANVQVHTWNKVILAVALDTVDIGTVLIVGIFLNIRLLGNIDSN